ncbi:MAG: hypothetical protein HDT39_07615 [Lachnospiraceae bacterium]|nr:hypothetical protein [Lachnospiraceae bacterium]
MNVVIEIDNDTIVQYPHGFNKRREYAKKIRKDYEASKIKEHRFNMCEYTLRIDGLCNTITTVQKDSLVVENFQKPLMNGYLLAV